LDYGCQAGKNQTVAARKDNTSKRTAKKNIIITPSIYRALVAAFSIPSNFF